MLQQNTCKATAIMHWFNKAEKRNDWDFRLNLLKLYTGEALPIPFSGVKTRSPKGELTSKRFKPLPA
jgi:hypothetical protein